MLCTEAVAAICTTVKPYYGCLVIDDVEVTILSSHCCNAFVCFQLGSQCDESGFSTSKVSNLQHQTGSMLGGTMGMRGIQIDLA